MLLPVLAFCAAVMLVIGLYTAVCHLPKLRAERRLELRLREVSQPAELPEETTVVKRAADGPLPVIGAGLSRLIEQAGARTSPGAVVMLSLVSALFCGTVTFFLVPMLIAFAVAAALGLFVPTMWLMHRRSSRLKRFEEQFPEALDLLARAIRAGHAFQTGLGMVADELPDPVGPEFKKTFERQNFGLPLRDAMTEMMDRIPILDVRFFVTSVAIQRETGGNLAEILDNLAHVVRERFKIRRQVRVHTAHGRFTGYVLLALPAVLVVVLSFIAPEQMTTLFQNRMGQMMIGGAIVMQTVGFFWIRQVIKIEV